MLTAATFAVAIIGSIAGIFGMNLSNGHEDSHALFLVVGGLLRIFAYYIANFFMLP